MSEIDDVLTKVVSDESQPHCASSCALWRTTSKNCPTGNIWGHCYGAILLGGAVKYRVLGQLCKMPNRTKHKLVAKLRKVSRGVYSDS